MDTCIICHCDSLKNAFHPRICCICFYIRVDDGSDGIDLVINNILDYNTRRVSLCKIPNLRKKCLPECSAILRSDYCYKCKVKYEVPTIKKLIVAKDTYVHAVPSLARTFDCRRRLWLYVRMLIDRLDLPVELILIIAGYV
jgi:hypothetical protein